MLILKRYKMQDFYKIISKELVTLWKSKSPYNLDTFGLLSFGDFVLMLETSDDAYVKALTKFGVGFIMKDCLEEI